MPWYLWVGGYLTGFMIAWRIAYAELMVVEVAHAEQLDDLRKWRSHLPDFRPEKPDRELPIMIGLFIALFWPAVVIGWLPYKWITRPTPAEIQAQERRELAHLRKQAKELGLPFPETDDTNR